MQINEVKKLLRTYASPEKAKHSQRFFKTGKGEYGEGDRFLGITVPQVRSVVKASKGLDLKSTIKLLHSPFHEDRLCALLLMVDQYQRGDQIARKSIYRQYLEQTAFINNWDLVDSSAHKIVGPYLEEKSRKPLYQLARSNSLWERRIAMMATYHFIRQEDYSDTLKIAKILLTDKEDLIHKVVGWMLREIGKKDLPTEESFLKLHYQKMPRTMLRYAIEKFSETKRKKYLAGRI